MVPNILHIIGSNHAKFLCAVNIKEIQDVPLGEGQLAVEWKFQHADTHGSPEAILKDYPSIKLFDKEPLSRVVSSASSAKSSVSEGETRSTPDNIIKDTAKSGRTPWLGINSYNALPNTLLLQVLDIPLQHYIPGHETKMVHELVHRSLSRMASFSSGLSSHMPSAFSQSGKGGSSQMDAKDFSHSASAGPGEETQNGKKRPSADDKHAGHDKHTGSVIQPSGLRLTVYWKLKDSKKPMKLGHVRVDLSQFAGYQSHAKDDVPSDGISWRFLLNRSRLNSTLKLNIRLWCIKTGESSNALGVPILSTGIYEPGFLDPVANTLKGESLASIFPDNKLKDDDDDESNSSSEDIVCLPGDDVWAPSVPANFPLLPGHNDPRAAVLCQGPALNLIDTLMHNAEIHVDEDWATMMDANSKCRLAIVPAHTGHISRESRKHSRGKAVNKLKAVVNSTRAVRRLAKIPDM